MKFFTKQNFMHDLVTGYVCILLYLTKLVDTWLRRIGSCQFDASPRITGCRRYPTSAG
jgi:hypothetical protein